MESEAFTPLLEEFMLTPLVTWVKTLGQLGEKDGGKLSEYIELVDGIFLNEMMLQINPTASVQRTNKNVNNDPTLRIQNLTLLIRHIKSYYQDTLQQFIMMPLPDVLILGRNPLCEQGLEEMRKFLLLILGCAVQCEEKEEYISRIQTLDFQTKAVIASHIQEVTHNPDNVLDLQWLESEGEDMTPDDLDSLSRSLAIHLKRLLDERDEQLERIVELTQERDCVQNCPPVTCSQSPNGSPSMLRTESRQHLSVELADAKARIRRLRRELEEKNEQLIDSRQELDNIEVELKRIQQENIQLLGDARSARAYRDELDTLREKAFRVDKLESELGRYKERLHDMEFYRVRVEELKEDNQVLLETKAMLEDQLQGSRARSDKLHELEKQNLQLKAKIHDMEMERDSDRKRMEELLEENLALEISQKRSMDESLQLGWELDQLSRAPELKDIPSQKSLGLEVSEVTCSRLLKLEQENQMLQRTVELLGGDEEHARLLRAERENKRFAEQVKALERENARLSQTVAALPQGSRGSVETRMADLEQENHALHKPGKESGDESRQKDLELQRESMEQGEKLEREKVAQQKKSDITGDMRGMVGEDGAEQDAEIQTSREKLQALEVQVEALEKKNAQLEEQKQELVAAGSRASRLELEVLELQEERTELNKSLELLKSSSRKTERLEASCLGLETENQRLQKSLENRGRKIQRLEDELREAETENQGLQRSLEELKISSKRVEQLEKESRALEQESSLLERDRKQLEKENRRLRQQAEVRDASLDESQARISQLERENRALSKEVATCRESCSHIQELEKDNKELLKQVTIDKKTLLTLREELVHEKLKGQQMNDELDKLTQELQKIGLNKERLLQEKQSSDQSRCELLESPLESTLQQSLQLKEEKMAALQSRLEESCNFNQELRQELNTVMQNYEALQRRVEEVRKEQNAPLRTGEELQTQSMWERESREATRELLKVKDRLIEVERNNATLQAEKQALRAQLKHLETRGENLQEQILVLQRQTASLQENNTSLQTHNAKLQVESSTLNSQNASLLAQNAQLQNLQSSTESEREGALREREDLRSAHELLLRDHERLAALHERQASEYEALIAKHGGLKGAHKSLELQHRTLEDRYNQLLQQKDQLKQLERDLRAEQEKMALESSEHKATADRYQKLKEENDQLNTAHRQLLRDSEALQAEHRALKTQLNSSKLEQTRLEAEFSRLKEQYQQLDITSTKLTNQCELLSQLKGNLEEENRHLLDQIQTLMLQNRTLLEQTMESKDLFHTEQRQYIDRLNELRRQKEKLEEKIMDQYKFCDPSPPRRRGNWITLKMRKLMKPKSRMRSLADSAEAFSAPPDCQDSSSQGSGSASLGSGSTSLDDTLSQKKSSTMNDLLHTEALSGGQWATSSENLDQPEGGTTRQRRNELGSLAFSTSAINSTSLNLPISPSAMQSMRAKGNMSNEDVPTATADSGTRLRGHAVNGSLSRPQSESSGEFSPSLENEAWSSGSSPAHRTSHHGPQERKDPGESSGRGNLPVESLRSHCDPSSPTQRERVRPTSGGRGILRSASGRAAVGPRDSSPRSGQAFRPSLRKAESTRVRGSTPRPSLSNQSKSTSVSERLNSPGNRVGAASSGPALPRASNVISTAEGSNRRTSIHETMAKDTRMPISVDPSPSKATPTTSPVTKTMSSEYPSPPSSMRLEEEESLMSPAHTQGLSLGSSFTIDSVFMDTIFSDAPKPHSHAGRTHPFLSLNPSLVSNISGPPPKHIPWPVQTGQVDHGKPSSPQPSGQPPEHTVQPMQAGQGDDGILGPPQVSKHTASSDNIASPGQESSELSLLSSEDAQSLWFEYGCV
ncbi:hypothetical protein GJAV_G00147000 [Gymnothorax javanicus]|nr:hypothetical protein GJAV_G00147000 [Gymnothorax javanicus]